MTASPARSSAASSPTSSRTSPAPDTRSAPSASRAAPRPPAAPAPGSSRTSVPNALASTPANRSSAASSVGHRSVVGALLRAEDRRGAVRTEQRVVDVGGGHEPDPGQVGLPVEPLDGRERRSPGGQVRAGGIDGDGRRARRAGPRPRPWWPSRPGR